MEFVQRKYSEMYTMLWKDVRIIDTHCHVNFQPFRDDWQQVVARAFDRGVGMINVGTNFSTSTRAVEIAEQVGEGMVAAVGLHPIHLAKDIREAAMFGGAEYAFTTRSEAFDKRKFFKISSSPVVVGVGESGLDYYHLDDFRAPDMTAEAYVSLQQETLYEIMGFAREIGKPHIFHCRDAYDDFAAIVQQFTDTSDSTGAGVVKGVVHCFTGTWPQAQKMLELGFFIGFTGIVTFPNAKALQEVARQVPLERMLLETDSPYLAPQPVRGQRNEPVHVWHVAEKIAELKGLSVDAVAAQTTNNAAALFSIPIPV